MEEEKNVVVKKEGNFELTLECADTMSYYSLANGIKPIKRFYLKNVSENDVENIRIKVTSRPDFLVPYEFVQQVIPRRTTARFALEVNYSPTYLVGADERTDGDIDVEVYVGDDLALSATAGTEILAFDECDFAASPESLAAFVRRTSEVNRFMSEAEQRAKDWKLSVSKGYGSRNGVRNYFAACYSVIAEEKFVLEETKGDSVRIVSHKELFDSGIAAGPELALFIAALAENNGHNAVVGIMGGRWYVGVFLTDECCPTTVWEDPDFLAKKASSGVNDLTLVCVDDVAEGVSFEKAEKNAKAALKKADECLFIDIKRARIINIRPLPERKKRTGGGYDLEESKDYVAALRPSQIREFKGSVEGDKETGRIAQWERKLLDMDMRNALLNFKISRTACKLLTPSIQDLFAALDKNRSYTVEPGAADAARAGIEAAKDFARISYTKPFTDFVGYEYSNKRLLTVYDPKEHEGTLFRLFRKESSVQEETGTTSLYLAAGFLRWKEENATEFKYAPLFLFPVSMARKGLASPVYTVEFNTDDVRLNSTLLEFLYRQFNLDIRGLGSVALSGEQSFMSVMARIKRETVEMKGWEVFSDAFFASLSFANYQLWYDIKYRTESFREHPIVRSLIDNRLELPEGAFDLSDRSSDEAYIGGDRMYLPISADSSQYSAIYDSLSKSFVLHGPPGTGKSQTITNIIANNIVRGRRVLFVAEKKAALSVVHSRLKAIGLADFCLELHSGKTNKNAVLGQIVNTLALRENAPEGDAEEKIEEIKECVGALSGELEAMHRKRYLGISLYEGILEYFENQDAPDCLRIDSLFYEKLTAESFRGYLQILAELSLRAKECGDIQKSPFKHIGGFVYDDKWRARGEAILEICLNQLKNLRSCARNLLPYYSVRTVSLTEQKLDALYKLSAGLNEDYAIAYFSGKDPRKKDLADSYLNLSGKASMMMTDYRARYGAYPTDIPFDELTEAASGKSPSRRLRKILPEGVDKAQRTGFFTYLARCEQTRRMAGKNAKELRLLFGDPNADADKIAQYCKGIEALYGAAAGLYADFDQKVFEEACAEIVKYGPNLHGQYYVYAYEGYDRAMKTFCEVYRTGDYRGGNEIGSKIDYLTNIQKNFDYVPNWCRYQEIVDKCRRSGLEFVLGPLGNGEITASDVMSCFKKCVYFNFVRSELLLDETLSRFSGMTLEETANRFREITDEYERLTRAEIFNRLAARLPRPESEGDHSTERVLLMRAEKTNMKGMTLRSLFSNIPSILKVCCPCMMMSPTSVTQFLDVDMDKFDLVIFDEASQLPTCKAVGSIVRGKNLIVVGDPQQLPPTTFFNADVKDDEHYESEDLESILDDCLALGMPENRLRWHYRSRHESLIAFSNATFYDNTLLTFPSPNELNSKVRFRYVDGIYERGGEKCNKKEGDELVADVVRRLKDPVLSKESIGVVTFNIAQQNYIENALNRQIHEAGLDQVAFEREEPLFVKNLENVQGDERDVILFSVGYGPDKNGKLSLNFGPINQSGGQKRLNVAVTRARSEMCVFSAIRGNMIDLSRTNSKGVECLKYFLEYAERGKDMLAIGSADIGRTDTGIGEQLARELKDRGIACDSNVGVSDFKIDVAVVDPRDPDRYILAVLADSENSLKLKGVKDRVTMHSRILRRLGWNTYHVWCVNYFNNPKREIQRIKDAVAALVEKRSLGKKAIREIVSRYREPYKAFAVKPSAKASGQDYVLNAANKDKITEKIRAIIERESPIEQRTLLARLSALYALQPTAKRALAQLTAYADSFVSFRREIDGKVFYVDKPVETFRPNDTKNVRDLSRVYPDEAFAAIKCALEVGGKLSVEDTVKETLALFGGKKTKAAQDWIAKVLDDAVADKRVLVNVEGLLSV